MHQCHLYRVRNFKPFAKVGILLRLMNMDQVMKYPNKRYCLALKFKSEIKVLRRCNKEN